MSLNTPMHRRKAVHNCSILNSRPHIGWVALIPIVEGGGDCGVDYAAEFRKRAECCARLANMPGRSEIDSTNLLRMACKWLELADAEDRGRNRYALTLPSQLASN